MRRVVISGVLTLLLAVLAVGASSGSSAARESSAPRDRNRCIQRQQVQLAYGPSTGAKPWTITAAIHNFGPCDHWFFEVSVVPSGERAGSWREGWSIPAGGSLPGTFRIAALDEGSNGSQVFSGIVAARVRTIELVTNKGRRLKVNPKLPPDHARNLVWLGNVRYFLRYYPAHQYLKIARLLDSRGRVVYVAHRMEEGRFDGPCCLIWASFTPAAGGR